MANLYLRRREILRGHEYDIGTLKYWWSSEDAPVNSRWADRISGIKPELRSNPYDSINRCYECNDSKYLLFNMNTELFSLGNHWRIALDAEVKANSVSTGVVTVIDFGSVGKANKAASISLNAKNHTASINWKMQGNNSNPGTTIYISPDLFPEDYEYHRLRFYYEIVDGDDGYDRFNCCINGELYRCLVQIPKANYGPTWSTSTCYFGRGLTNGYAGTVRFYDIRMYQID